MEIPDKLEEIESKLKNYGKKKPHQGLIDAYASAHHKRNPRIATILLVGLTGAGKSSTVNMLFNHKLAETGGSVSCTSDIIEYEMTIPYIEEIDSKNLKLRIIDTPGFGDTRDPDFDAQLVATLRIFFQNHEDLSGRYPTIVLICGKFDDTRYSGENSPFVKMLKGLDYIKEQIFDTVNNNVVLCLTHFMNAKKDLRLNPDVKCTEFSTLVGQFTCMKNTPVVVGENEAKDRELENVDGNYKLPNGAFYPHNVFDTIQKLLDENHDNMGEIIIRTVFSNLEKYQVKESKRISMLATTSREVTDSLKFINRINYQIKTTPINENIEKAWKTLTTREQNDYPSTLLFMQRVFERNKIYEMSDVPNTPLEILKLVKDMQPNPLVGNILEQAVGILVPKLNISLVTGQCYNVINFKVNTVSIFDFDGKYEISPLGYLLPSHIKCDMHNESSNRCEILSSTQEYVHKRLNNLSINVDLNINAFGGQLKSEVSSGYNIIETNSASNSHSKFTACRETKMFRFNLKTDLKLSKQFQVDVSKLPAKFTQADFNVVEQFKTFFTQYGTHVVASCFGGGSLEISCTVDKNSMSKSMSDKQSLGVQVQAGFMNKFSATFGKTKNSDVYYDSKVDTSAWGFSALLKGGSMEFHAKDLATLSERDSAATYAQWLKTVELSPLMLTNQMHLIPISNYVREFDIGRAEQIEAATSNLFKGNLIYIRPPQPPPPPPRQFVQPPPSRKSSCLKKGTKITLANGQTTSIEKIKAGDILLDMNLQPTKVIVSSFVFLGDKDFWGFEENCQFFTTDHIMVAGSTQNPKFLVASKSFMIKRNPLIESLIQDFRAENPMLKYENGEIKIENLSLFKDPQVYKPSTKIYFLFVDSPSGTFIANGFVTRHDLPEIEKYLPFFLTLKSILESKLVQKIVQDKGEQLTQWTYMEFEFLVEKSIKIFNSKKFEILSKFDKTFEKVAEEDILNMNLMEELSKIMDNDCKASLAMIIYERCAKNFQEILENNLDESLLLSGHIAESFVDILTTLV